MDRTSRQKLGIKRWLDSGGIGSWAYATGVGKGFTSCMLIKALYKKNPNLSVLIAVPTQVLKEQWIRELAKNQLFSICKVEIFNTIEKQQYTVDLFIVDECHLSASEGHIKMYEIVKYRYLLGLSATWERLDGREILLEKYTYVCDRIGIEEAAANNWLSEYRNYKVLLDVDLKQYNDWNQKFQSLFSIFGFDFQLAMSIITDKYGTIVKKQSKRLGIPEKELKGYASAWMNLLRKRKGFVMSHPKKFEIANKILDARKDKKCITFSATIKDAETFKKRGYVLHSKKKKKENTAIIEKFNQEEVGVLSSAKSCDQGMDLKGLSVGIILSGDSSKTRAVQRLGRCIRLEPNKLAEMFTLVIKGTVEERWFNNSNEGQSFITIDEKQLDAILQGKTISTRPKEGLVDKENRY